LEGAQRCLMCQGSELLGSQRYAIPCFADHLLACLAPARPPARPVARPPAAEKQAAPPPAAEDEEDELAGME
jgi:hypothetical protein